MESLLKEFHEARVFFLETNIMSKVAAPRQHALTHYVRGIRLFGALNGLCSSMTESKHIDAVKKPWRHSNRNAPIVQMMLRISRLEKLAGLKTYLASLQLTWGTTSQFMQDWMASGDERSNDDEARPRVESNSSSDTDSVGVSSTNSVGVSNADSVGRTHIPLAEEDDAVADEDYLEGAGITTITSSVKVSQTHGTYHV
jgi:hypothetical protein